MLPNRRCRALAEQCAGIGCICRHAAQGAWPKTLPCKSRATKKTPFLGADYTVLYDSACVNLCITFGKGLKGKPAGPTITKSFWASAYQIDT